MRFVNCKLFMSNNKITFLIISTILFVSLFNNSVSAQSDAPQINMTISSDKVSAGSEVEFKIFVESVNPINAFDITLVHTPDLLELVSSRTDRSIASIWQSFPITDTNGKIRLVGGMTSPFTGKDGEIITLVFKAIERGDAELTVERADIALADGKGTLLSGGMGNLKINILAGDNNPIKIQNDAPAPKISDVLVLTDPTTTNPLIMVRSENDGGIKELQVRSRSWLRWGAWQKSDLTASYPKNAWSLQVKAIGFNNAESNKVVYFWSELFTKLGMLIGGVIVFWFIFRRYRRSYAK